MLGRCRHLRRPSVRHELAAHPISPRDCGFCQPGRASARAKTPVQVELGVMSRCPDALVCESVFDQVLKEVGSKMNLSLIYVAKFNSSEPDFGITCMHGVGDYASAQYSTKWWDFVQCQNSHGRYAAGVPEVTLECAGKVGLDWEASSVGRCAGLDGKASEGVELLRKSVSLSKSLGIEKSCTVLINRKQVCVHDGGWDICDGDAIDFVKRINEEYERLNG
ncbi:hypothetical protein FB45DRAFT_988738 [Roridomyces roridus]|uniref:Uncharacterized protein n=1 Tax=Roridomyces roridus TaxID=1738132 RepID=A0AAD7C4Q5_9AGAR|nr:hypothetical protein FB45DRAFT_988738 [Roridomyces roridus]